MKKRQERVFRMNQAKAEENKRTTKIKWVVLVLIIAAILAGTAGFFWIMPAIRYNGALQLMSQQRYEEAVLELNEIAELKDVTAEQQECYYHLGEQADKENNTAGAYDYYVQAGDYKDAREKAEADANDIFTIFLKNGDLDLASEWLDKLSKEEQSHANSYLKALALEKDGSAWEAIQIYQQLPEDYRDTASHKDALYTVLYDEAEETEKTSLLQAIELYEKLPTDYADVRAKLEAYEPYRAILGDYKLKLAVNSDTAFSYRSTDKDIAFSVDGCVRQGAVYLTLPEVCSEGEETRQVKAETLEDGFGIDYNIKETGSTSEFADYVEGVLVLTQYTDITYENSSGSVGGELFSLFTSGWNEWIGGTYYEAWAKDGADYLEAVQRLGLE